MYNFKKMLASVIAVGTMATSIVSLLAEAGSLSYRPDSAFAYDLAVEGTTDGLIKVTLYTTYNPGVYSIGVAILYDTENLNWIRTTTDFNYGSSMLSVPANNSKDGICIYGSSVDSRVHTGDYEDPFVISFYFENKNDSTEMMEYDFVSSVYEYNSITENINYSLSGEKNFPSDKEMEIISKEEYTRKIGDVIPNSVIQLEDAMEVLSIIALCEDTGVYPYTSQMNTYLTSGFSSQLSNGNMLVWNQRFADTLYANNVAFAEVADCDQNGLIEQTDADMLMEYYAQQSAALKPESLINTEISKVVYAEITM